MENYLLSEEVGFMLAEVSAHELELVLEMLLFLLSLG